MSALGAAEPEGGMGWGAGGTGMRREALKSVRDVTGTGGKAADAGGGGFRATSPHPLFPEPALGCWAANDSASVRACSGPRAYSRIIYLLLL